MKALQSCYRRELKKKNEIFRPLRRRRRRCTQSMVEIFQVAAVFTLLTNLTRIHL
jgi:hypothetical protein